MRLRVVVVPPVDGILDAAVQEGQGARMQARLMFERLQTGLMEAHELDQYATCVHVEEDVVRIAA